MSEACHNQSLLQRVYYKVNAFDFVENTNDLRRFGLGSKSGSKNIDRVALAAVNQFLRHPKRIRNATTLVKRISREHFMSLSLSITIANVHGKNTNGSHRFELEKNTFLDVI